MHPALENADDRLDNPEKSNPDRHAQPAGLRVFANGDIPL